MIYMFPKPILADLAKLKLKKVLDIIFDIL